MNKYPKRTAEIHLILIQGSKVATTGYRERFSKKECFYIIQHTKMFLRTMNSDFEWQVIGLQKLKGK